MNISWAPTLDSRLVVQSFHSYTSPKVADSSRQGDTTLSKTLQSLADESYARKTVLARPVHSNDPVGPAHCKKRGMRFLTTFQAMQSKREILASAFWRFYQLRGYVDDKHNLTAWGKVLNAVFAKLNDDGPASQEMEEAGIIALELFRLDLLNNATMFPNYIGAPMHGSGTSVRIDLLRFFSGTTTSSVTLTNKKPHRRIRQAKLPPPRADRLSPPPPPPQHRLHRPAKPPGARIHQHRDRSPPERARPARNLHRDSPPQR